MKLPEQLNGYELLDEKIGDGTYAKVWLAKHKKTGEIVAIKIIHKEAEFKEVRYDNIELIQKHTIFIFKKK